MPSLPNKFNQPHNSPDNIAARGGFQLLMLLVVVAVLTLSAALSSGAAQADTEAAQSTTPPRIVHCVFAWLKEPDNEAHRQALIDATESFRAIPGVLDVRVGRPHPSDRAAVDDSFDVGLYVTLRAAEDLPRYLSHPIHLRALESALKPYVARSIIYDFESQAP